MKPIPWRGSAGILLAAVLAVALGRTAPETAVLRLGGGSAEAAPVTAPTSEDSAALTAIATLARFHADPAAGAIWPGYRPGRLPLLLYVPGRWALLLGATTSERGFTPYPKGWPELGVPAAIHPGTYRDLVGQIDVHREIGSLRLAAIPIEPRLFVADSGVAGLGFVMHEAFHRHQRERFTWVETGLEERYPILDEENLALGVVEMRLLADAMRAFHRREATAARERLREFVAVRAHRWKRLSPLTVELEREKELVEGTAQYVEARGLGLLSDWCRGDRPAGYGCARIPRRSAVEHVIAGFEERLAGGFLDPEDLPRNSVYPVGAAMALALDALGATWKTAAEGSGGTFRFPDLLQQQLGVDTSSYASLRTQALARERMDSLRAVARAGVEAYRSRFQAARDSFEAQPGTRVSIELPSRGLRSSRSARGKRWILDEGRRQLATHYIQYELRNDSLWLRVRNAGIDEEEISPARRRLTLFVSRVDSILVDGTPVAPAGARDGDRIEVASDRLELRSLRGGRIEASGRGLQIDLRR